MILNSLKLKSKTAQKLFIVFQNFKEKMSSFAQKKLTKIINLCTSTFH